MCNNDNNEALLIFVQSTTWSHSAPQIMWAHSRSSKCRFRKTSFHQRWCADVSSSPPLRIPWKVSWVIYNFSSAFLSRRNKERGYLEHRWVMSPSRRRGILFVAEPSNIAQEPTRGQRNRWSRPLPEGHSLDDWMLEQRHRWNSVLSEMGQGELMGFICCTRIPFILVATSQSHLSPLSKSYSPNPLMIQRPTSVPVPLNCSLS